MSDTERDDNPLDRSANPHQRLPEILRWYACGADGWSVYGHVIAKFSWMGSLPHFLTHGAPVYALLVQELH